MRSALLLVDLQHDFLRMGRLEPPAEEVVATASALLGGCRSAGVPVLHVWTSITNDEDRMPHWRAQGRWLCVAGTEGHATPDALRPRPGEDVLTKTFFSAFGNPSLDGRLRELDVQRLLLAGVHLHGCVRATALDAYQRGLEVCAVEGAVGSYDGLHGELTRHYLDGRAARFVSAERALQEATGGSPPSPEASSVGALSAAVVDGAAIAGAGLAYLDQRSPRSGEELPSTPICGGKQVARATAAARRAGEGWRATSSGQRRAILERLAGLLERNAAGLAHRMAVEIGKPVRHARAEVARTAALARAAVRIDGEEWMGGRGDASAGAGSGRAPGALGDERSAGNDEGLVRRRALGVVALVTPFNNPLAVPVGKIAPAVAFGNTIVWKPAPAACAIALELMGVLEEAGLPAGVVNLVCGDASTAHALMSDPDVDALTVTGSSALGHSAALAAAGRRLPLQAELGGNNAAIIWSDCDLAQAAAAIARAAFGSAGQRCTANRRVVVDERCCEAFVAELERATAELVVGDPLVPQTEVGPLVSEAAAARVRGVVERARDEGWPVLAPHAATGASGQGSAYCDPVIVRCDDPSREIVQQETFGPVAVVQSARDFDHALALVDAVPQGLVAALLSASPERQAAFLDRVRAGVLKLGSPTADVGVETPFGGWKGSGFGPPEHGDGNREFYTRAQAVYLAPAD